KQLAVNAAKLTAVSEYMPTFDNDKAQAVRKAKSDGIAEYMATFDQGKEQFVRQAKLDGANEQKQALANEKDAIVKHVKEETIREQQQTLANAKDEIVRNAKASERLNIAAELEEATRNGKTAGLREANEAHQKAIDDAADAATEQESDHELDAANELLETRSQTMNGFIDVSENLHDHMSMTIAALHDRYYDIMAKPELARRLSAAEALQKAGTNNAA
ncbi:hypothetical protein B0A48_16819, partial [Cryoendolithus antarcticus]